MADEKKPSDPLGDVVPLRDRVIKTVCSWHDWLKLWNQAERLDQYLALARIGFSTSLHAAYGERQYNEWERVAFYISEADGWHDECLLDGVSGPECFYGWGTSGEKNLGQRQLRQLVAQRMYEELCRRFFTAELSGDRKEYEMGRRLFASLDDQALFSALKEFFRISMDFGRLRLHNLSLHDHKEALKAEEPAKAFLLCFIGELWSWKVKRIESYDDAKRKARLEVHNRLVKLRVEELRLWSIEALSLLGHLGALSEYRLNKACRTKLREIAMRNTIQEGSRDRPVANLQEAVFAGSSAAIFLLRYNNDRLVLARLKRVERRRQAVEAERRRREEILRVKKQKEELDRKLCDLSGAE